MKSLLILAAFLGAPLFAYCQNRFDIVIDEIMADPSPVVGLPNYEWIELKNTCAVAINLQNWRIVDENGMSGPLPAIILQPDSLLIVCGSSAYNFLSSYGRAVTVSSFPSLDNNEETIYIRDANGKIIHALHYSTSWYQNELKKQGGWTLEMIDTHNPCMGIENWKAAIHPSGGTPGRVNSVNGQSADNDPPQMENCFVPDSLTIMVLFNEPVDSLSAADPAHYTMDGGITVIAVLPLIPLFNSARLTLANPLVKNKTYNLKAINIKDCRNNLINPNDKIRAGLPSEPGKNEMVINEILFDPRPNAHDFVELYNNSNKIIDASKFFIANRDATGNPGSIKSLSNEPLLIFPGDYVLITEDPANLSLQYLVKNEGRIFSLVLPSYPDDEGDVLLLNGQGEIIDEVNYKDDWHFKLLSEKEGVSLERIDPAASSNEKDNWHSAASTAGFATPGYKNSQYRSREQSTASIGTPRIFSPDNDGRDDIAMIQYQVESPGYVANVGIYDPQGRLVRVLVNNQTIGLQGYWNWDGLDNNRNKLPVGPYIVLIELFNLEGKVMQFKKVVVLARFLN